MALIILMLCVTPLTVLAGRSKVTPTVFTKGADGRWAYEKVLEVPV